MTGTKKLSPRRMTLCLQQNCKRVQCPQLLKSHWAHFTKITETQSFNCFGSNILHTQHLSVSSSFSKVESESMSLIGIICMPDGPGCGSAGTESCLNVFTCLPFPCLLSDLISFVHCFFIFACHVWYLAFRSHRLIVFKAFYGLVFC